MKAYSGVSSVQRVTSPGTRSNASLATSPVVRSGVQTPIPSPCVVVPQVPIDWTLKQAMTAQFSGLRGEIHGISSCIDAVHAVGHLIGSGSTPLSAILPTVSARPLEATTAVALTAASIMHVFPADSSILAAPDAVICLRAFFAARRQIGTGRSGVNFNELLTIVERTLPEAHGKLRPLLSALFKRVSAFEDTLVAALSLIQQRRLPYFYVLQPFAPQAAVIVVRSGGIAGFPSDCDDGVFFTVTHVRQNSITELTQRVPGLHVVSRQRPVPQCDTPGILARQLSTVSPFELQAAVAAALEQQERASASEYASQDTDRECTSSQRLMSEQDAEIADLMASSSSTLPPQAGHTVCSPIATRLKSSRESLSRASHVISRPGSVTASPSDSVTQGASATPFATLAGQGSDTLLRLIEHLLYSLSSPWTVAIDAPIVIAPAPIPNAAPMACTITAARQSAPMPSLVLQVMGPSIYPDGSLMAQTARQSPVFTSMPGAFTVPLIPTCVSNVISVLTTIQRSSQLALVSAECLVTLKRLTAMTLANLTVVQGNSLPPSQFPSLNSQLRQDCLHALSTLLDQQNSQGETIAIGSEPRELFQGLPGAYALTESSPYGSNQVTEITIHAHYRIELSPE